ncbi:hypothetical protein PENSPDRAFT_691431 [Peniophora sp. CONT]|nr:hypothetical protein PENSPDRAFT_691431 [Peniophora sp. CONT]
MPAMTLATGPDDILRNILTHVAHNNGPSGPLRESHVCRQWRDVALSDSSFWAVISFAHGGPKLWNLYAERAKERKLTFIVIVPDGMYPSPTLLHGFLNIVRCYWSRAESFTWRLPSGCGVPMWHALRDLLENPPSTPVLHHLEVRAKNLDWCKLINLYGRDLHTLTLKGQSIFPPSGLDPTSLPRLSALELAVDAQHMSAVLEELHRCPIKSLSSLYLSVIAWRSDEIESDEDEAAEEASLEWQEIYQTVLHTLETANISMVRFMINGVELIHMQPSGSRETKIGLYGSRDLERSQLWGLVHDCFQECPHADMVGHIEITLPDDDALEETLEEAYWQDLLQPFTQTARLSLCNETTGCAANVLRALINAPTQALTGALPPLLPLLADVDLECYEVSRDDARVLSSFIGNRNTVVCRLRVIEDCMNGVQPLAAGVLYQLQAEPRMQVQIDPHHGVDTCRWFSGSAAFSRPSLGEGRREAERWLEEIWREVAGEGNVDGMVEAETWRDMAMEGAADV